MGLIRQYEPFIKTLILILFASALVVQPISVIAQDEATLNPPEPTMESVDKTWFTPNEKDLSVKFLEPILGPNWGYMLIHGVNTDENLGVKYFTTILFVLNILCLAGMTLAVVYFGVVALTTGALSEQRLSQSMSPWSVIRSPMAIGAAIPMPHMGGLSIGQGVILFLLWHSIGFAGTLLNFGAGFMVFSNTPNLGGMLEAQETITPMKVAGMAATARYFKKSGSDYNGVKSHWIPDPEKEGKGTYLITYDFDKSMIAPNHDWANEPQLTTTGMGNVEITCPSKDSEICSIKKNYVELLFEKIWESEIPDQILYRRLPSKYDDGKEFSSFNPKLVVKQGKEYKHNLNDMQYIIDSMAKERSKRLSQGFIKEVSQRGWITAGAWHWAFFNIRQEIGAMVGGTPTAQTWWESPEDKKYIKGKAGLAGQELMELAAGIEDAQSTLENHVNKEIESGGMSGQRETPKIPGKPDVWGGDYSGKIKSKMTGSMKPFYSNIGGSPQEVIKSLLISKEPLSNVAVVGDVFIKMGWFSLITMGLSNIMLDVTNNAEGGITGAIAELGTGGWSNVATGIVTGIARTLSDISFITIPMLFIIGLFLAIYVPSIPLFIWVIAVLGWFLLLIEALVAFNFWVITFVYPQGEGFSGQRAQQGFVLLLDVLVRAPLMTIGFLVASGTMGMIAKVIGEIFIFGFTIQAESTSLFLGTWDPAYIMGFTVFLCAIIIIIAQTLFGLVNHLSNNVVRWFGQQVHNLGNKQKESEMKGFIAAGSMRAERGMKQPGSMGKPGGGNAPGGGGSGGGGGSSSSIPGLSSVTRGQGEQ